MMPSNVPADVAERWKRAEPYEEILSTIASSVLHIVVPIKSLGGTVTDRIDRLDFAYMWPDRRMAGARVRFTSTCGKRRDVSWRSHPERQRWGRLQLDDYDDEVSRALRDGSPMAWFVEAWLDNVTATPPEVVEWVVLNMAHVRRCWAFLATQTRFHPNGDATAALYTPVPVLEALGAVLDHGYCLPVLRPRLGVAR